MILINLNNSPLYTAIRMKKLILLVMIVLGLQTVQAQTNNFIPYRSKVRYIGVGADSSFYIPWKDTTFTPFNMGFMTRRPQDSLVYIGIKTTAGGKHWDLLGNWIGAVSGGSSGGGITQLWNTGWGLIRLNDSTYLVDSMKVMTKYQSEKTRDSLITLINGKQATLVSGTNIKTVNGNSLLGSGDLAISGGGASDTSTFIVDTLYNAIGEVIGTDTVRLKSVRVQAGAVDITPTTTDSTVSFNVPQFSISDYGVVPPASEVPTDVLYADGTWGPVSGGGSTDTIPYSYNPADWLVSLPHRTVPYFYTSGVVGDPTGSYYESSMYTPTPVHITNGTNKGKIFVVTKGDLNRKLFGWISSDKGFTWDTTGVVLAKSTSGFDKDGVSMAHMIYDSLTNVIHMWYMGYSDSLYPSVFGVGYATASGDAPSTFTKQGQVLSGESFRVQMGMPHKTGYLKVSSVVKSREDNKYYFHGSYWLGNGTTWSDSTIRLWQGKSATIGGLIDSSVQILAPTGTHTLLENPTVWYHDDGNYWMILTNGYTDLNGGIDSVQYLQTAKSPSLTSPNWVVQPGIVFYPTRDSTWMGKRVYNAQLLKNTSGYYDRPISLLHDSLGRGVNNMYETQWMLFYSASYPNSYHDQSSIIRLTPQRSDLYTASVGFNGNIPNIVQKNGSIQVNIPFADTTKRWSGGITWDQLRDLYRSVKTGTMGQLAYYDSSLRRVRGLPTFSVTVGSYPTFTFGAAGYSAASVYFRNGVGTTGMISEDGGMNYYGSSTYMSHYFRDKISGGIVLARLFSSSGSAYAYFTGKNVFGSNATATSHLQTDKTFAGIMAAAKTSAYTIADDYSIPCDATSAAFTVTLPQANGCPGRIYIIKKIDASGNAVTVDGSGTEPIDGALTLDLATQWKYVVIQSTGSATTGWYIIGGN